MFLFLPLAFILNVQAVNGEALAPIWRNIPVLPLDFIMISKKKLVQTTAKYGVGTYHKLIFL